MALSAMRMRRSAAEPGGALSGVAPSTNSAGKTGCPSRFFGAQDIPSAAINAQDSKSSDFLVFLMLYPSLPVKRR